MTKAKERAPGPATGSATSTPVTLSTTRSSAHVLLGGELLGLVFLLERVEQLVELSVHDFLKLIEGQVDAVVRDAPLWKLWSKGADSLVAIACFPPAAGATALVRFVAFAVRPPKGLPSAVPWPASVSCCDRCPGTRRRFRSEDG